MFGTVIAAAFLAAQLLPPSLLDDDGDGMVLAEMRPAVACLDRFHASPEAEYHVGQLVALMVAQPDDPDFSMPTVAAECIRTVPDSTAAHEWVSTYAIFPLVMRALARHLATQSVDIHQLNRTLGPVEVGRAFNMPVAAQDAELIRLAVAAGVPEHLAGPATVYAVMRRMEPIFDIVVHLPAQPARHIAGSIGTDDYPASARRQGLEGRAIVSYTILATGNVQDCEVIISTGHRVLDERTCALLTARYLFQPPRDETGRAVEQRHFTRILWRLR